jgi:hypothetical protein
MEKNPKIHMETQRKQIAEATRREKSNDGHITKPAFKPC